MTLFLWAGCPVFHVKAASSAEESTALLEHQELGWSPTAAPLSLLQSVETLG